MLSYNYITGPKILYKRARLFVNFANYFNSLKTLIWVERFLMFLFRLGFGFGFTTV